jgi:hypothetical protein
VLHFLKRVVLLFPLSLLFWVFGWGFWAVSFVCVAFFRVIINYAFLAGLLVLGCYQIWHFALVVFWGMGRR